MSLSCQDRVQTHVLCFRVPSTMLLARMVHIWEISEAKNQVSFLRSLLVPPLHAARHHAWPIESYHDAKCSPSLSVGTNYCLETQGFAPFHLTSKVPSVCTHVNAMMLSPRQQNCNMFQSRHLIIKCDAWFRTGSLDFAVENAGHGLWKHVSTLTGTYHSEKCERREYQILTQFESSIFA